MAQAPRTLQAVACDEAPRLLSFKEARSGRDLCAAANDPSLSLRTIGSVHSRANRDARYPAAAAKSPTTIIGTCTPSWHQTMRIPRKHVMWAHGEHLGSQLLELEACERARLSAE